MKKFYLLLILILTILFTNAQTINNVQVTQPLCAGDWTGSTLVNVSQTAPATYVDVHLYWQNNVGFWIQLGNSFGANNQFIFNGMGAGNFYVEILDTLFPNVSLDTLHFTVTEPPALTLSYSQANVSCNGYNDGSVDLTIGGGTGNYSFSWSGSNGYSANTEDIIGLTTGSYVATVIDANGCPIISSPISITEPLPLIANGYISQSVVGFGNFNGQITASASGGTVQYQYSINNGVLQSSPIFSNLGAGSYLITYIDANGCNTSEIITLTQPVAVSGNISILNNISCAGYCDGALQFNVIGGNAPFEYSINNGPFQTNNQFTGLCGDSLYSITVRDNDSSTFVSSVYLNEPNELTFTTAYQNINGYGVSCNWDCDGAISINNVSGGAGAPIMYSFDGGVTFSQVWSIINLCPSNYYIAVMDGSGCVFRDTVSINTPDSLQITSLSSTDISCYGGSDGTIDIDSIVGGVGPYLFTYSNSAGLVCSTIYNSSSAASCSAPFGGYPSGTYYVDVTDANGCLVQDSLTLTEPDLLEANFYVQNNFMPYDSSAAINSVISGGVPPYQVNWIGPNGFSNNNEDIDSLFSGTYYVTIVDNNSCIIYDTIVINEPGVISGCTDSTALNYNDVANFDNGLCYYCSLNYNLYFNMPTTQFTCDGWIAAPVPSGAATAPISWHWSNGTSGNNSFIISGLCNDTFSVTIIDANSCGADTSILLSNYIGCTDSTMFNYDPLALFDNGSCIPVVGGCTDSTAFNYNPNANTNNVACIPVVSGCMDTLALNYNINANTSASSCIFPILGCMDSTAINFNPLANIDDGSCNPFIYGCTDPNAANYNPYANTSDNSCWYCTWGCMDSSAFNYDPLATCNDSLCIPFIYGCTDPLAFNFNSSANTDDGSCYASVYGCTDSIAYNYDSLANIDNGSCYNCSFSTPVWFIDSSNIDSCQAFAAITLSSINGGSLSYTWNTILGTYCCSPSLPWAENLCLGVYSVTVQDAYGCTTSDTITIGNIIQGCTDPIALNYDSLATLDDGSCCLPSVVDLTVGTWNFVIDWGCTGNNTMYYINYFNNGIWSNPSQSGFWELCGGNYTHSYFVDQTVYTGTYSNGVITGTMTDNISTLTGCFSIYLDSSSIILGCMDITALNYNGLAQVDDGSCLYLGCTDSTACNYDASASQDDGSCILPDGCTDPLACNYDSLATCDDGSCLSGGCTDPTAFNYDPLANCDDGSCIMVVYGCLDPLALNYYPGANTNDPTNPCCYIAGCTDIAACNYDSNACYDDGSCLTTYGCTDSTAFNYDPNVTCDDGSCIMSVYGCTDPLALNYSPGANTADPNDPCCYIAGCTDSAAINYDSNACWSLNICTYCVYGCTNLQATNYDPNATCDDGSCTYPSTCNNPTPTGINVMDIIHTKARVKWDNMSSTVCTPEQYRVQYRELGTTIWSTKNAVNTSNCGPFNQTGRLLTNLTPGTTYEYRIKVYYCFTTGSSPWTSIYTFNTLPACPNVGNFAVSTPLTTKATFTWDDSNGPYSFARIKMRVDSISNPTGADWQNVGGFGVVYPTFTRNKNGLTPGETYRGQSRTWCDPAGGPYKSSNWTSLIFWTQPTVIRLEGGSAIANLDVYPNPSRDIFNVTFTSEEVQNLKIKIVNLIGEELLSEDLQQFIGEYTKQIDLANNAKGIYFLEIETQEGVLNKKLILQ